MNDESAGRMARAAYARGTRPAPVPIPPLPGSPGFEPETGAVRDDTGSKFDPLELLGYLLRHRWLIAGIIFAGLILGVVFTMVQTPLYRAKTLIEIVPPSARVIKDLQVVNETGDQRTYRTALEKLRGREMARRVVHELALTEQPAFMFPRQGFSLRNLVSRAMGRGQPALGSMSPDARERRAVSLLKSNLATRLLFGTSIISITYSSDNPDLARQIADQFANSYIAQRLDQTVETSTVARQFIAEQVDEVKKKLQASEKSLVNYAKSASITVTGEEGSLIAAQIKSINDALSKVIQERLTYERLTEQINAGRSGNLEQVLSNEAIARTRSRIAELQATYQQKRRRFKPDYPEMLELQGQIQELKKLMQQDVSAITGGIELQFQVLVKKENDLRDKLKDLEVEQASYRDKNIQYTILKREVDSYRLQYQSLINKLNDLGVSSEIKNKSASIVQYAITPESPYSPRLPLNLALALAASVLVSAVSVYAYELLNNTFSTPDQVESELKLSILGVIPHVEDSEIAAVRANPRSTLSEAYRTLRTSIHFSGFDGAPRSLVVTSTEAGEGKSSTSTKLAEEFGALGMKVVIIDADLRKPTIHRYAGVSNRVGLSNFLTNSVPVSMAHEEVEFIRATSWQNVWMVTAGTPPPNPANLLASQKLGLFVEDCMERFDLVIIDSPPVIGLSDALLLSRLAEATLLVVSAHQVARSATKNACKNLRNAGAQLAGVALTKFRFDRMEYNYSYRYMNSDYLSYGSTDVDAHQTRDTTVHDGSPPSQSDNTRPSLDRLFNLGGSRRS